MRKVIVFGNSGSGKSTLSSELRETEGLAHLDLDTLAWLPSDPPERRPLEQSHAEIRRFTEQHEQWVVEGCYADLLELVAPTATEAIFMNLPVPLCQENARNRPWEPHKYESKAAQDANLSMLLEWIAGYPDRQDLLSYAAHRALYDGFPGHKREVTGNEGRMSIRTEQPPDPTPVRAVNEAAFETPAEADLVDALRAQADPYISLVAEHDGAVIGHIMFSPVELPDHSGLKAMGLGPMAVAPEHQRRGIGAALIRAGLEACEAIGVSAVVVLGHPEYYPRFGFSPASGFGIGCEYEVPDEAFMALELQPGFLDAVTGTVRYHPAFDGV